MNPLKIFFSGGLFFYLLCYTHVTYAAGFFTPSHGAHIQGRGGCGVLSGVGINAMWYNPSLLADLGRLHLTVDATLLDQSASFKRAPRTLENGNQLHYAKVTNLARPITVPQLGLASNFGFKNVVLALGAWAPNGLPARYPEQGPQRYTLIDTEGSAVLSYGLGIGWRTSDWLLLGLGLQNHFVRIRLVNMLTAWPGVIGDPEDPNYDLLFEGVISSPWTPSGNFGLRLTPYKNIEVGLSLQLPVKATDENAKIKQRLPSHVLFDTAQVSGDTVKANFQLPWVIRSGLRLEGDRWDFEVDLVMEQWSSFRQIEIKPNNVQVTDVPGIGTIEVNDLSVPRDYQNTKSLRFGGDVKAMREILDVRGGVFFEESAVPNSTLSVLQIDAEKMGLSTGLTWFAAEHLAVDLAYTYIFYQETKVQTSEVRQINPAVAENVITVGEGTYKLSVDLISLGLRYNL